VSLKSSAKTINLYAIKNVNIYSCVWIVIRIYFISSRVKYFYSERGLFIVIDDTQKEIRLLKQIFHFRKSFGWSQETQVT